MDQTMKNKTSSKYLKYMSNMKKN